MGYLDYAGLQYLWGKLKEKFAPKSHSHDDRYYTESEMDGKLGEKAERIALANDANLNDIKTPGFYHCGGGNSIINKPSGLDAIGLIVVRNANNNHYTQLLTNSNNSNTYRRTCLGGVWSAWTIDKYTDTNTWRGIQNNLTSDSTSDSLSAAQGKALKALVDGKLGKNDNAVSATTSKALQLLSSTRQTSMNFNLGSNDYKGKVTYAIASSSTTDGKPPADSVVQNWSWDSNGYGAQVAVAADANPRMYIRGATNNNGASKWDTSWKTVAFTDDKPATAGTADKANSVDWSKVQNKPTTYPATSHTHPYLPISGGTVTGNTAITGSYLQVPMITGETSNGISGTAQIKKAHGIQLGIPGRDYCNFYEYGGVWNFYKTKDSYTQESGDGVLIAKIDTNGVHANLIGTADNALKLGGLSPSTDGTSSTWGTVPTVSTTGVTELGKYVDFHADNSGDVDYDIRLTANKNGLEVAGGPIIGSLLGNANTANSAKALSTTVTLTGGDGNTTGYRLVAQCSIGQWTNNRSMFFVKSRHQGSGFVVVTIGNNSGTVNQANAYAEIIYYGPQNSGSVISDTAWQVYVSADGKTGYLFWKYGDYSECNVQVINSAFTLSNGTWMTSIGSGYGACKAKTSINPSYTTQLVTDSGNGTWTSLAYSKSGMSYDDYTWLAGWNNYELRAVNKNQFATAGHDHDLNKMINKLSEATADPQDNDYYISQYSGGGTTTTTYHRRPIKALWNYIKGKTDAAYLKLTGGTITGQIKRDVGCSWIYDRDNAIVYGTSSGTGSGYHPVIGQKTPSGAWTIGTYSDERLIFDYTTDANKTAGTNNGTQVYLPAQAGTIITSATIGDQSVSKANSATTASKLGTNAGSTTNPVYFKDGVPVAGTYTLSDASTKTVRTLTAQGPSGWKDAETDQKYVPDMAFMAYWNGAYNSNGTSNLQYCDRGRFGTIITKGSGDYLPIGGGTLTGDLKFSDIGDTATSHKISWAGSTDGADIYYQTTAKDQGNLVLNLRDDANCYLRIASNGAFKSYFSPSDGNFHGNVNGNASSASGYTFKSQTSDPGANSSLATGTVLFVYE